jgi:hypothetical protein
MGVGVQGEAVTDGHAWQALEERTAFFSRTR